MESHRDFLHRQSTEEELKKKLLHTAMELETTRAAAQAELTRRDNQISILNHLLKIAIKERDEALHISHKLHLLLQTGGDPVSEISGVEEEEHPPVLETEHPSPKYEETTASLPLPEKGKLLQAVVKAGPLLQTLLLAGTLPEWRNQPPELESSEIPPVGIGCCGSGGSSGSAGAGDGSSSPTRPYKLRRVAS